MASNDDPTAPTGFARIGVLRPLADHWARVAAVVYAFGFIVVNHYLARYAIATPSLIEGRYLSAGILFTIIVGIPAMSAPLALRWANRQFEGAGVARQLKVVGVLTVAEWAVWAAWSIYLLARLAIDRSPGIEALVFVLAALSGIGLSLHVQQIDSLHADDANQWWQELLYRAPLLIALVVSCVAGFASGIYPKILPQYGGGAAPAVRLVLRPDYSAATLGLPPSQRAAIVDQRDGFLRLLVCPGVPPNKPLRISVPVDAILAIVNEAAPGRMTNDIPTGRIVGLTENMCGR